MNKETEYILQQDYKTPTKTIFSGATNTTRGWGKELRDINIIDIENNPKWFLPKKEVNPTIRNLFPTDTGYDIILSDDKCYRIKRERLAEILIAESKNLIHIDDGYTWYREDSVLKKIEDCWKAARKNNSGWYFKFKSLSEYLNSKQKQ